MACTNRLLVLSILLSASVCVHDAKGQQSTQGKQPIGADGVRIAAVNRDRLWGRVNVLCKAIGLISAARRGVNLYCPVRETRFSGRQNFAENRSFLDLSCGRRLSVRLVAVCYRWSMLQLPHPHFKRERSLRCVVSEIFTVSRINDHVPSMSARLGFVCRAFGCIHDHSGRPSRR